jgi:hypothetical protein
MATQSEIGTWQQIAAWEKSLVESDGRKIAPSPPKLKTVKQTENIVSDADKGSRPSPLRP